MAPLLLQNIWLVPVYSIIGAVLSIIWFPSITKRTGPRPAGYVNALMTLISFVHSLIALQATWNQPPFEMSIPWLQVAGLDLTVPIVASSLSVGAMTLVTGLNLAAQIFAIGYLEMDWGWARFFSMLALFEAGMCALVLCDSLFFGYMVLEILTLCTYLLIGIWFNQSLVVTGARDAFLTKRIGDLFLLMGLLALYPLAHTWNYTELAEWAKTAQVDPDVMALIGLALIAGPMGKCAQFPLHLWLDEAMEGPIPASILRNSVVVATGAWVLVKLEPVLALSPQALNFCILIGAVTAVGSSMIAIAQIDVKRALSYLVSAYMGVVFIAVGVGELKAALLLVLTHGTATALMMMAIGGIIWNCITQDLRQYGGLWARRPMSGLSFLVGTVTLVALPPFGSFWAMLELADDLWSSKPWLVGILLLVNALTAFGLVRVFSLIWGNQPKPMTARAPEVFWPMTLPMMITMGFSLHLPLVMQAVGLLPVWADVNKDVALLLFCSSVFGGSLGGVVYLNKSIPKPIELPWKALQDLLAYDFYTRDLYRSSVVSIVDLVSRITSWLDKYLVDGIINLFGVVTTLSGQNLKYSTSGKSQFYMLTILLGVALMVLLVSWPFLSGMSVIFSVSLQTSHSIG
jgi:NAD(P)H-quinone oxidoreductase subunit 5